MLCIKPGSSEFLTRLIRAARGFADLWPRTGTEFQRLAPAMSACLLLELRPNHLTGSGACFLEAESLAGCRTWYGLEVGC